MSLKPIDDRSPQYHTKITHQGASGFSCSRGKSETQETKNYLALCALGCSINSFLGNNGHKPNFEGPLFNKCNKGKTCTTVQPAQLRAGSIAHVTKTASQHNGVAYHDMMGHHPASPGMIGFIHKQ